MPGIMADNDVPGQFNEMLHILKSDVWRELWDSLQFNIETFESIGLSRQASDRIIWQTCQENQVILFTGNRNMDGPDSLEAALRTLTQTDSRPVLTLSDPKRFGFDPTYSEKVAEKVLDYLLNLDIHRGAGRLFVP